MRNKTPKKPIQDNQQGIVAIVVTIILMVILTLIVLSFAKISRREERDALDRQLSTQAFYAAESGIDYAKSKLESDTTGTLAEITQAAVLPSRLQPAVLCPIM